MAGTAADSQCNVQTGEVSAFHCATGNLDRLFHFQCCNRNVIGADAGSLHGRMRWGRPYKKGHCTSIYGWNRPYKGARALLQHFDALQRSLHLLRGPRHL